MFFAMKITFPIIIIFALLLQFGCRGRGSGGVKQKSDVGVVDSLLVRYAKGFRVKTVDSCKLVEISDPTGENKVVYRYALVPKGCDTLNIPDGYTVIKTPVDDVICMTTLQLSGFIKLGATDRIAGITSTRFLQNEKMRSRMEDKTLHRIGIEGEFDVEVILSINPDVILVSPFKRGGYGVIEDMDIPMISYLAYKESSPLGQAEWIKFIGLLIGEQALAEQIFSRIEKRYLELEGLTKDIKKRPTIMSGELHSGNWYVVGGDSYLAQIFSDAGAEYFMKNDNESGGFYLDYETVYSRGYNADYWRIVNSYTGAFNYDALGKADSRYCDFKSFKDKGVIYCNLRDKPFYENTPMEPEVVLADLIKIFHPELLVEHQSVYYEILR